MVKLISDWERSGAGAGMVNDMIDEDGKSQETTQQYEYEFLDGDDWKSFLCETSTCTVSMAFGTQIWNSSNCEAAIGWRLKH